ncbi:hypothetical protein Tco_1501260 [Tanacetum coccineum]
MYHNVNQLQWQLERENLYSCDPKTCLDVLRTQFKEFFDSKEVNSFTINAGKNTSKIIRDTNLKLTDVIYSEKKIHKQKSLVTESTTLEANLSTDGTTLDASSVTEGTTLEACLVTKGIEINDSLAAKESLDDSVTSSEHLNESSNGEKIQVDMVASDIEYAEIGPSYDSDTVTENQNDVENPSLLNKANELVPSLYNTDEMGNELLFDHKIISEEELKCEAEKHLKVKQRKYSLSYHGFVYGETQFEEPPKVPLKRKHVNLKQHLEQAQLRNYDPALWKRLPMKYFCYVKHTMHKFEKENVSKQNHPRDNVFINSNFEDNFKRIARNRLSEELQPLVKDAHLQLNCFEKGLVKEMKDDLKFVTSLEDEFDETCLILDIQQEFFKTQFESVKLESHSHVYENEFSEQNSSLENENHCLKKTITELSKQAADVNEEMTKRCAYVKSESGEKNILFRNETSSFETKIKEFEMTLAQQTKDFEDAKVDFSKKTDKFETYFEKLKNEKFVLERQLDRKIHDFKAEKEQFLKQIASLESNLASQNLILNKKEYNELRISYNALKAKFDVLNQEKGKSLMSNVSTQKVSVSPKIYTGESSKSFPKRVSQFTTYSLQKDRKFS